MKSRSKYRVSSEGWTKVRKKSFNKKITAFRYAQREANRTGEETLVSELDTESRWISGKGFGIKKIQGSQEYITIARIQPNMENPQVLKKLRRGIKGFVKLSRGRLVIRT